MQDSPFSVPRIHLVGRKNSGKTTLIVELVKLLTERGLRVATIKHTHHHHELDVPGKDSHRHRQAGAQAVGVIAPSMNALFWPSAPGADEELRYTEMMSVFAAICDLVLVEGHSGTSGVKIEVWRACTNTLPLATEDRSILALITDDSVDVEIPTWSRRDGQALAEQIERLARGSQL